MANVGFIVGIVTAFVILISGIAGAVLAKKNQEKRKWPMWAILAGIIALISTQKSETLPFIFQSFTRFTRF